MKPLIHGLAAMLLLAAFAAPAAAQARRVNAPHFPATDFANGVVPAQTAVFWFGRVDHGQNYADVRVGYSDTELWVRVSVFDQWLWTDNTPAAGDLDAWDAVTLTLHTEEAAGAAPSARSFRLVGQLNNPPQQRTSYQAAYVGNGAGWTTTTLNGFVTDASWRGGGLNDGSADRGWMVTFRIPFASLGVTGPPATGTTWRLGVQLHDRDAAAGPPLAIKTWPETLAAAQPSTWGQLGFGLRSNADVAPPSGSQTITIRHGAGTTVQDAMVGGGSTCAEDVNPNFFDQWGALNHAGSTVLVEQNQGDVADWPCYSKIYVDFPLGAVPAGKQIVSATLTLHQFGGSDPSQALRSLIQVSTLSEAWSESTITWNTAPMASENVAQNWVDVINGPPWPNLPRTWNVSWAVTQAYGRSEPVLRLALYSADGAYHSGKYFHSSQVDDFIAQYRPTLQVVVQDSGPAPGAPTSPSNLRIVP